MSQVKLSSVWAKARQLAEKHPNAVYRTPEPYTACYNLNGDVWDGDELVGVGCIVGQAIVAVVGGPPDWLIKNDGEGVDILIGEGFINDDDMSTFYALEALQSGQDCGNTWGEALTEALTRLPDSE